MNADKLIKLGIDLRNKWSGEVKTTCPKCAHQRKKKNDPSLGVNIDDGVWKCHHCGWSGSVNQYVRPEARPQVKTEGILSYFTKRAILSETVTKFQISEGVEWMPQDQKEHKVICFNYFLEDDLINIKFKTSDKMFKMVKDARKIPYNINSIKDQAYVIICEGEEECMVWDQCGHQSVVSVPNGASKNNNNLEWLDAVYDMFEGKIIYLATDNDEPGRKLGEDLARRFDASDIRIIRFPEGQKDANDCLKAFGGLFVSRLFEDAEHLPVAEISSASDYRSLIESYYESGYPVGSLVDMSETDNHLSWNRGELVVVTGIPGCFDKNQLVHTKRGAIPISQIKVGDYALSYNEEKDINEWKYILATPIHKTTPDRMFKITLKDGTVIKVTENHEFYTGTGYMKIKDFIVPLMNGKDLEENT
jgi:twinkle protein